ncbi:MAG: DUF3047 domain-containing protein [Smithellaceae bacterium]|nr:DUF3047 domain-containing protein [Smithellaceae bacterium]
MKIKALILILTVFMVFPSLPAWAASGGVVAQFTDADMKRPLPSGWTLEKKSGTPRIKIEKDEGGYFLCLGSDAKSSFGIRREYPVNVKETPFLSWRWKAMKLPKGGDVRKADTDDEALQLYIAFPATGFPEKLNTPVVAYVWDSEPPKGITTKSPQPLAGKVRYIVLRNKTDKLNQWYTEKRNVYEDYRKLFKDIKGGEPLGDAKGVLIYTNATHTRSEAQGCIGGITFSRQ